ncbi:TerC family protein [Alkalihalobacillus oceani]|uniref:TerC family protein n=1 Tax=Halalkalibacter oceani TaxID=1653776 RepID=A0A9X2DSP6_9BACI|nr:TerC family protein [Halalkalibacter oceani]MCM3716319.1 TerC family protein [Halalkalibacter oceani]
MEWALFLEYSWVLLVLIVLEGILAADNALVLAIMVKHLPDDLRKKALFYGLAGAFVFRLGSLFIISFLVNVWQLQAIGALYLLFIAFNHLWRKAVSARAVIAATTEAAEPKVKKQSGFWMTVLKVEIADIAFAVDSILAAVALAMVLPATGLGTIGGLDAGQFLIIFIGGFTGVVIMRFAATFFVKLLHERPGLEVAAFMIVGWVGVKLAVFTMAHPSINWLPHHFPESGVWKIIFWAVLVSIALSGWFLSGKKTESTEDENEREVKKMEVL